MRRFATALALVTVLALAACAGPAQSDGEALMPTPTQSVEPENVETDEPSAEPTAEIDPASEGETDTGSGVVTAPSPSAPPFNEADLVTVANNASFAAIMALDDPCSADIAAFARDYRGLPVRFDGNLAAFDPSAANRDSLRILAGDQGASPQLGPAFQYRDILSAEIGLSGTPFPEGPLFLGQHFTVTAFVMSYESSTCLVLLDPITTAQRG